MENVLEYYKNAGELTDLKTHMPLIEPLTGNPRAICQTVQGLMVHGGWLKVYGISQHDKEEAFCMAMSGLMDEIIGADQRPLAVPRLPEDRIVACCRDFSVLACAILRMKGIPARARCGFSIYLGWEGTFEDHWVVEYWDGRRWIMNDPQIDPFQLSMLYKWGFNQVVINGNKHVSLVDPSDINEDDFLTAARAWQLCRKGKIDSDKCGIEGLHGLWFVRGQLLRDFAALNKVEVVPHLIRTERGLSWDAWRLMALRDDELNRGEWDLLDHISQLSLNADENFHLIKKVYAENSALNVPEEIMNVPAMPVSRV